MNVKNTLMFITAVRLGEIGTLLSGYTEGLSAMDCEEIIADIKRAQESLAAAEGKLCIDIVRSEDKEVG